MPRRLALEPLCRYKVAELRNLANQLGIDVRNEDGKLKLKCDLFTEVARAQSATQQQQPTQQSQSQLSNPNDMSFFSLEESGPPLIQKKYPTIVRKVPKKRGVSFSESPEIIEFIPDKEYDVDLEQLKDELNSTYGRYMWILKQFKEDLEPLLLSLIHI